MWNASGGIMETTHLSMHYFLVWVGGWKGVRSGVGGCMRSLGGGKKREKADQKGNIPSHYHLVNESKWLWKKNVNYHGERSAQLNYLIFASCFDRYRRYASVLGREHPIQASIFSLVIGDPWASMVMNLAFLEKTMRPQRGRWKSIL